MAGAAPIGASLDAPPPKAEPAPGGQVLERALVGDVGAAGRQSNLPLELRKGSGQAGIARAESAPASAIALPSAARINPTMAPAPAAVQVPSLLHGQLVTSSNEVVARPEAPKLARDWTPGGPPAGAAGSMTAGQGHAGTSGEPGTGSGRANAGPSVGLGPLVWLSQGLAFIRENRMGLLAGVGGLVMVLLVQQARGRRRKA